MAALFPILRLSKLKGSLALHVTSILLPWLFMSGYLGYVHFEVIVNGRLWISIYPFLQPLYESELLLYPLRLMRLY